MQIDGGENETILKCACNQRLTRAIVYLTLGVCCGLTMKCKIMADCLIHPDFQTDYIG